MITLKESQLLHRAHLKVVAAETAWKECLDDPRGQVEKHRAACHKLADARDKWMRLLTRLTEPIPK